MHKKADGKGSVVELQPDHMARLLRSWLKTALGDKLRPELHQATATRKALTWHDLRATGATWMAVRGDDPLKIKQRCGHASFSTTEIYIREAEAVRDGFGDVFPPLPDSLLKDDESSGESSGGRGRRAKSLLRGTDSQDGARDFAAVFAADGRLGPSFAYEAPSLAGRCRPARASRRRPCHPHRPGFRPSRPPLCRHRHP